MSESLEVKKAKWASRRGLLELDLVLEKFVSMEFEDMTRQEKERFGSLLEFSDDELFDWFFRSCEGPERFSYLIKRILSCYASGKS